MRTPELAEQGREDRGRARHPRPSPKAIRCGRRLLLLVISAALMATVVGCGTAEELKQGAVERPLSIMDEAERTIAARDLYELALGAQMSLLLNETPTTKELLSTLRADAISGADRLRPITPKRLQQAGCPPLGEFLQSLRANPEQSCLQQIAPLEPNRILIAAEGGSYLLLERDEAGVARAIFYDEGRLCLLERDLPCSTIA